MPALSAFLQTASTLTVGILFALPTAHAQDTSTPSSDLDLPSDHAKMYTYFDQSYSVIIHHSSTFFLQETTNVGEKGQDSQGDAKQHNGIDDDGNGIVDDYKMLYARTELCDVIVFISENIHDWKYYVLQNHLQNDPKHARCLDHFIATWQQHSNAQTQ